MGRRFGDWVCEKCRRVNRVDKLFCEKCGLCKDGTGKVKIIHKWVDCEDNMSAQIYCEYNNNTKEVFNEWIIFSSKG